MKTKIILFFTFILFAVLGSPAFAQNVSGTPGTTGCLNQGTIAPSNDAAWSVAQYQLWKGGVIVAPIPGDASQFSETSLFVGLSNGTYTVVGKLKGTTTTYTSKNITVADGYTLMKVATPTQVAGCATGKEILTTTVTGGKKPYTYDVALQSSPGTSIQRTSSINDPFFAFNALPIGNYIVSVTDSCGQTVTGATAVSAATVTLADLKNTGFYPIHWTDYNCSTPFAIAHELGFQYVANSTSLSAADAALFTWKIKYQGKLYGKDIDGDGYSDEGGDGYPITTRPIKMPVTATRDGIFADINNMRAVVIDKCGNTREFVLVQWQSGGYMSPFTCGGEGMIKVVSNRLACFPVNVTFTNLADASDVITQSINVSMLNVGGLKPGATYHLTYVDAGGNTTNDYWTVTGSQNITIPASSGLSIGQSLYGVQPNQNILGYGKAMISMFPSVSDSVTFTIVASDNPLAPVGSTGTGYVDANGTGTFARINASDPVSYWPKGNYTVRVNAPCGTRDVNLTVQGYNASLTGYKADAICGGFNYTMQGVFDDASAYQVIVVSGPSNVGQVRDLASTTASLPFNGLNFGTYVFGLRIKGGSTNVLTQTVTYDASNAITVDKGNTGGYVCNDASTDGVLTITATTISPAPNNTLKYALSTDGGVTYGTFQSSNQFSGLGKGTYYFKVQDGCGNVITQTTQMGVAALPTATANGLMDPILCKLDSGTIKLELDVDITNAALYEWTGPGITAATKNLKNPPVSYQNLVVGLNTYTCKVTLGAPCNLTNTSTLKVTLNALPKMVVNNPAVVCAPNTVNLKMPAVTQNSDAGLNYTYFTDADATTPLANPDAVNATGTYYIKGTNSNGCSVILPVNVTVNPLPTATISGTTAVCQNTASPDVTFTGAGGTPPYTFTYKINNGNNLTKQTNGTEESTSISINTGTAGVFRYDLVSVQDSSLSSCAQNQTGFATVTVNALPTATIAGTKAVCKDATMPNVIFTGAGGTAPYTFTYKIGSGADQTVTTVSGNSVTVAAPTGAAGTFTYTLVSVKDANSCNNAQTGSAVITVNPLPTATIAGTTAVCKDAAAPNVTFTGAGGTAPYTFTYKLNSGADQTVTTVSGNLVTIAAPTGTAGTFTYTLISVKDANSCDNAQTGSAVITVNPLPTATIAGTTAVCKDATAPNVTFTGAGGTAPYTFTYKIGSGADQTVTTTTGNSVTVAAPTGTAGTFTYTLVSVKDASSTACTQTQTGSAVITVNPLPTATIAGTTAVCKDATMPNVTFTGAGGTAPYTFTYKIGSGADQTVTTTTGNSVTVAAPTVTAGTFTYSLVSVKDASSTACTQTQIGSVVITVNPLPTATIAGTTAVCKDVAAPNVTFTGAGGTAPYTFTYKIGSGADQTVTTTTGNSVTVAAPTGTAGTFTYSLVSVKDASSTACTQTQTGSAVITVNPLPTATIAGTTAVCKDVAAPNVTFTGAGGTAPYTFTYKIGSGADQTVTTTTGNSVTVAAPTGTAGTFTYSLVSVKDASSTACTQTQTGSAVITVNPLPTATIAGTTAVCKDAVMPNITFTGAGGTAPYTFTYKIGSGADQTVTTTTGNSVTVAAPTVTAGTFTYSLVSVKDASSTACTQTQTGSAVITVNPLPTATIAGTTAVCKDAAMPNVTFTGAGGTAPYTFTYKIGSGADQTVTTTTGNSVTVAVPTGTAGSFAYTLVSVKDNSSTACVQTQTGIATITVNPLPTAVIAGTTAVCKDVAAPNVTFTGAGGTAPYTFTYKLNGGADQTVTTVSGNSVTVAAPTGTAGTFTYSLVSVKDASSTACTQTQTGSAVITVNPLPTATIAGTTAVCKDTAMPNITFTGAGGTAPYTFTFKIGSGVDQTVTTTTGNSVTVAVPTGTAGTFTYSLISVRDSKSCDNAQTGSVAITVNELATAAITAPAVICRNATSNVTITGAGGTAPYTFTYKINNGTNQIATTTVGNSVDVPVTTSATGSFNYALVSVRDSKGCDNVQSGSVTIEINENAGPAISGSTEICQNAAKPNVTFTGSGGTAPYNFTYNVDGGANQTIQSVGDTAEIAVGTSTVGTITYNLVSVSDSSVTGCGQTQTGSAIIKINPLPTATIAGTTAVCKDAAAPNVTFTGAGGTAPYTFTYKIGSGTNQTVTTVSGNSVTVAAPTGTAGSFAYTLVSVKDNSSTACVQTQTGTATITVNPLPTAAIAGTTAVCKDAATPNVTFTGAGGTAPYTFTYKIGSGSNQTVTTSIGNSVTVAAPTGTAGTFSYDLVSVKDGSSTACTQAQTGSAVITVNPLPTASIAGTTAVCKDAATPNVTFTGAGGTAPYTFTYKIGSGTNQTVTTVSGNSVTVAAPTGTAGSFTYDLVSVKDASSTACTQAQTGSAVITVNPLPTATIAGTTAVCKDTAAPNVTFTGAGGTAPYTFTYKLNGGADQIVTTVSGNSVTVAAPTGTAGSFAYTLVSVKDNSSTACVQAQTGTATITVNPLPTAAIAGTTAVCKNASAPNVTFTGTNGTAPYTFTYKLNGGADQTVTTSTGNSVTVAAPTGTAGTFTYDLVSVKDVNSCDNTQTGSAVITVNELLAQSGTASTLCAADGTGYVLTLSVTGQAPYTVTGTGAPGTWNGNEWTSDKILAGTNYNVNIQDVYACNTVTVSDIAPICCVYEVKCPTFPAQTIVCYSEMPTAETLTKAQFEALGNGDGSIGNIPCGVIEITASNSADPACNGNVTRTYTVKEYEDANNNKVRDLGEDTVLNTTICTQTYTLERAEFVMPANGAKTVNCSSEVIAPAVPEVKDNCGNILTPSVPVISAMPACNGIETYTYTFTDCAGHTHDWVYSYTIQNTVAPQGTVPADITVQCIDDIPAPNTKAVINIIGNCNDSVVVTITDTNNGGSGCSSNPYILTRTYTLTDCGGLKTDLVQTITVKDTTAPVFVGVLPSNITLECTDAIPTAPTLTATDNCSAAVVTYSEMKLSGSCAGNYQLQRTWTAVDACGNRTSHMQTINVADTTAPVFVETLPAKDVYANCDTIPEAVVLTAADNCGSATVSYSEVKAEGDCTGRYALVRTWKAEDECGNQNSFTQTVHVSCLEVFNAISPNGDGLNDSFKINGIDCFPNNTVRIYNRYGTMVYEKKGYDNVTNPFEGFSDGRATVIKADKLPTGTYFYTLEYEDNGKMVQKSAYLYINNQ
ncbi:gliding motility-associated C-terminal domain-containing protein [Flavobacterium artemisiae]|uniref:Gliding motility-associated C-terminal domain-containing protein n=1 Tax=Flavobacterium artemisiae TaxID=2126556 RepID=A0ABW4HHD4_9FLAO